MTVGTTYEVLESYVNGGRVTRTATAQVPGGCRVSIEGDTLYSYRTAQAVRLDEHRIAVTLKRYSVTTSKLIRHLEGALFRAGYRPTVAADTIHAAVPGRWGGFGPAWHATGWENVPAVVYEDTFEARIAYRDVIARQDAERDAKAARKAARRAAATIGLGL